jgi:hypothetical protein
VDKALLAGHGQILDRHGQGVSQDAIGFPQSTPCLRRLRAFFLGSNSIRITEYMYIDAYKSRDPLPEAATAAPAWRRKSGDQDGISRCWSEIS